MSSTRDRLENLFEIGIDEVSWKRQHNYLTLVADHIRGQIVWGSEGNDSVHGDRFFKQIGKIALARDRGDLARHGPRLRKCAASTHRRRSSRSTRIHVVALGNRALDEVRRDLLERAAPRSATLTPRAVQGRPLVAAQGTAQPQRRSGRDAAPAQACRRRGLARLHPQGSTQGDLRPQPHAPGRHDPDRPVHQQGDTQPPGAVRPSRPDDPPSPRRDPPSDPARDQPRPHRSAQQQGPPDHTPRLRVPQRRRGARARDAHLRSDHPNAPTRGTPVTRDSPTSMPGEPDFHSERCVPCGPRGVRRDDFEIARRLLTGDPRALAGWRWSVVERHDFSCRYHLGHCGRQPDEAGRRVGRAPRELQLR